jgi:hypothetical protein
MKRTSLSILSAYFISRLLSSAFVYFGHINKPDLSHITGAWTGVDNWWLNPWTTYDSYWYLKIAISGYEAHTTAFFPLYPMILKLLGHDQLSMATAGVIVSHLTFLIALILIFKLTETEHDKTIAHITIWVICFFPSAAFWGAVYTESLFLALLAGTFLAARQQRWLVCSILAAAAALTRNPGVLLAIALYLEIRSKYPSLTEQRTKIYVPLAPLLAFGSVQLFYWQTFGNPLSGLVSQEYFNRKPMWPWQPLINDFFAIFQAGHNPGYYVLSGASLLITGLAILFVFFGYRKIPLSYIVLIAGITLMNLTYARTLSPSTISGIRYMGALFPFSQLLAIFLYKAHRLRFIGPVIVGLQLFLFIVYSYNVGWKGVF